MAPILIICLTISVKLLCCITSCLGQDYSLQRDSDTNLREASRFLWEYEREASSMCNEVNEAKWVYTTNITEHTKKHMIEVINLQSKFDRVSWRKGSVFSWSRLPDPVARRQLKLLTTRGRAALSDAKYVELQQLIQEMKDIYSSAKICLHSELPPAYCTAHLDAMTRKLAISRDYDELLHVWRAWRDAVGPLVRNKYIRYVELVNEAARLNGFRDAGDQQKSQYEDEGFSQQLSETWSLLSPLYRQLHAYVRRKLADYYGPRKVRPDGPIPAHILGNMWAQNWENILDLVIPFPGKRRADVTSEMLRQGYTPQRMFQTAEEFFTSMGMKPMPVEFWHKSMLERPADRKVACTASAWDFCNHKDYRMKQCTEVTMTDLLTTHHEMTHLQYYLQYSELPLLFRDGANPGFHEAFSDAILLSVNTPRHMHRIGLLNNITDDYETNINFLLEMALQKVAYLPFAYLVDQWRWGVFSEGIELMNIRWWELRLQHQGIIPPVPRGESDFDPASKYHIIADQPYINYFVSLVLQFQIHESLCQAAGHIGTIHNCDIYRSREAGRLLSEAMALGSSRKWTEVVKIITRGRASRLDARPMLEYFGPLLLWLRVQNRDEQIVGWSSSQEDKALFQHWFHSNSQQIKPDCIMVILVHIAYSIIHHYFKSYVL
ncbi:angiotensin-converting enzyme-like isoform X2 [Lycorma delicatula]|uniref:angiotensin-converting enzyme-like isoform X2 n=1 Tax=Lycorma delicatula TaxID=130591 RepID=UPI003F5129D2